MLWVAVRLVSMAVLICTLVELARRRWAAEEEETEAQTPTEQTCPVCGGTDIEGELPMTDGLYSQQEMHCAFCSTRWVSVYRKVRDIVMVKGEYIDH